MLHPITERLEELKEELKVKQVELDKIFAKKAKAAEELKAEIAAAAGPKKEEAVVPAAGEEKKETAPGATPADEKKPAEKAAPAKK